MLESIKKSLLAGLGAAVVTKEKIEKITQNLVEEGKISTEEAQTLSKDLIESGTRQWEDMQKRVNNTVKQALEGLDMCTKEDFTALAKKVDALEKRVAALEEEKNPAKE